MGLAATPVNSDNWTQELRQVRLVSMNVVLLTHSTSRIQEIIDEKYRVIITSPEMTLQHPAFNAIMRSPSVMINCLAVIVDKAHCISKWGTDFRKEYAELKQLRAMVPEGVPFLAASATLPPSVRADVKSRLGFVPSRTYEVNLGNDRRNITLSVMYLKSSTDFDALTPAIQEALDGQPLEKTMLFFNKREQTIASCAHLKQLLPPEYRDQVDFLHAGRSKRAKKRVMRRFRKGKIKILCATEAAGMVS